MSRGLGDVYKRQKENIRLKGILPKNFARPELDKRRLGDVVDLFTNIQMKEHGDSKDILGRTYEYCLSKFAEAEGKLAGEFYTPACIVRTLVEVLQPYSGRVYDPACGSGSLLLKAEKILGKDAIRNGFYGQEINITTYNLCRINMFLHDVGFDKFNIACEDTLLSPQHWDNEPFELMW